MSVTAGLTGRFERVRSSRGGDKDVRRFAIIVAVAAALTLPLAALAHIGGPANPAPPAAYAQVAGVTIVDFGFSPSYVAVPAGSTVSWYNAGAAPHTVTSSTGAFASGVLNAGGGYSATLWAPGVYGYYCAIHPGMVGTVEVS